MKNSWKNVSNMINYSEGGILSKVIDQNDACDVTLFCMAKDTHISTHTSTKAGHVYVVEGEGIFNLEGEEISMSPGTLIFMTPNAKHALSADENLSFILTLINANKK
jgi:quercetin dioxygenase-like cupin family protein